MATVTNRFGLTKPALTDAVDPVTQIADNMQKIDDQAALQADLEAAFDPAAGHGHTGAPGDAPPIGANGLVAGAGTDTVLGNRTINQTLVNPANTGPLTSLLSWIAGRIKAITGATNWYDAPATSLQAVRTHMDAVAPHSGHETPSGSQAKVDTHAAASAAGTHGSTPAATPNTLMHRDANGRAKAAAPAAADDIARKAEVDAVAVASVQRGTANTDVQRVWALMHAIDTRSWVATAWDADNNPTTIEVRDGATVLMTITRTYNADGVIASQAVTADGVTVTATVNRTGERLDSITRVVS